MTTREHGVVFSIYVYLVCKLHICFDSPDRAGCQRRILSFGHIKLLLAKLTSYRRRST